jgi:hypothetical protein
MLDTSCALVQWRWTHASSSPSIADSHDITNAMTTAVHDVRVSVGLWLWSMTAWKQGQRPLQSGLGYGGGTMSHSLAPRAMVWSGLAAGLSRGLALRNNKK